MLPGRDQHGPKQMAGKFSRICGAACAWMRIAVRRKTSCGNSGESIVPMNRLLCGFLQNCARGD